MKRITMTTIGIVLILSITAIAADKTGSITGTLDPKFLKRSDVLVYVDNVPGNHPAKDGEMDQVKLTFTPRVLPIVTGSSVIFKNSDDVNHNVNSPDNEGYDLGTHPKGKGAKYTFKKPGVYTQLCNVHPEMAAYVVVLQNPHWTLVKKDGDGSFKIAGVPPGKYALKIWGEGLKKKDFALSTPVTVEAGKPAAVSIAREARPKKEEGK